MNNSTSRETTITYTDDGRGAQTLTVLAVSTDLVGGPAIHEAIARAVRKWVLLTRDGRERWDNDGQVLIADLVDAKAFQQHEQLTRLLAQEGVQMLRAENFDLSDHHRDSTECLVDDDTQILLEETEDVLKSCVALADTLSMVDNALIEASTESGLAIKAPFAVIGNWVFFRAIDTVDSDTLSRFCAPYYGEVGIGLDEAFRLNDEVDIGNQLHWELFDVESITEQIVEWNRAPQVHMLTKEQRSSFLSARFGKTSITGS